MSATDIHDIKNWKHFPKQKQNKVMPKLKCWIIHSSDHFVQYQQVFCDDWNILLH